MNFKDLALKPIAIRCVYENEAKEFVRLAYNNGFGWENGQAERTYFKDYTSICYTIIDGFLQCNDDLFYLYEGYKIINFDTFINKYNDVVSADNFQIEYRRKKNTTIATLKDSNGKYIKHSKAICSSQDKYDFEIGKKIALNRLFNIKESEVNV